MTLIDGAARLERAISAASAEGRPALAPFLTAGYPARDGFDELLTAVCEEGDVVEVGVPFSDPMADGVTIQHSSRLALAGGVTLGWILDLLRSRDWPAPIVLMSYLNPIAARGISAFARDAVGAGVAGLIVPDLPFEESLPLRDAFDDSGLALIQLVTPVTPDERLKQLCEADARLRLCRDDDRNHGWRGRRRCEHRGLPEACAVVRQRAALGGLRDTPCRAVGGHRAARRRRDRGQCVDRGARPRRRSLSPSCDRCVRTRAEGPRHDRRAGKGLWFEGQGGDRALHRERRLPRPRQRGRYTEPRRSDRPRRRRAGRAAEGDARRPRGPSGLPTLSAGLARPTSQTLARKGRRGRRRWQAAVHRRGAPVPSSRASRCSRSPRRSPRPAR